MIDLSVADVMVHSIRTVTGETTASAVARLFAEHEIGSAVVVDAETDDLVGIVTESDIIRQVAADVDVASVPVRSFMTAPVVTVDSTASIDAAATLMRARSIRRLPVVDPETDDLVGIVTTKNLTYYIPRLRDAILRARHEDAQR